MAFVCELFMNHFGPILMNRPGFHASCPSCGFLVEPLLNLAQFLALRVLLFEDSVSHISCAFSRKAPLDFQMFVPHVFLANE